MSRPPLFPSLFEARDDDVRAFGEHWIGPTSFEPWNSTCVAVFRKTPENGDGQEVHVYLQCAPARFYTLRALDSPNSVGERQAPFALSTGSGPGVRDLVIKIAGAVSQGMLGLSAEKEGA